MSMLNGNGSRLFTGLDQLLIYGAGVIILGLLGWITVTTDDSARVLAADRLLFAQIQQNEIDIRTLIYANAANTTKTTDDIYRRLEEDEKRLSTLEYKLQYEVQPRR